MPQEIRVVQCFDCRIYQTDIVKKGKKWSCKVCGVKQALRTVYFRGPAADCRCKVQELNKQRVLLAQQEEDKIIDLLASTEFEQVREATVMSVPDCQPKSIVSSTSKWSKHVDNTEQTLPIAEAENVQMDKLFSFGNTHKWSTQKLSLNNPSLPISCNILKRHNSVIATNVSNERLNKVSKWHAFAQD